MKSFQYNLREGSNCLNADVLGLIFEWKLEFENAERRAERELIILKQEMWLEWRKEANGKDYWAK